MTLLFEGIKPCDKFEIKVTITPKNTSTQSLVSLATFGPYYVELEENKIITIKVSYNVLT